jgi:uncharacterized membrane protein
MHFSDFLVGKGYGTTMGRWTLNGYITVQAHNLYVEKLWQLGVAGLGLYVVMWAQMAAQLFRVIRRSVDAEERRIAVLLMALLAASLVYLISYTFAVANMIVFAYTLAFCHRVASKYPTNLELFRARMRALDEARQIQA